MNIENGFKIAKNLTRKNAKSFYFASSLLPLKKRHAAYAIYAICRLSDDAADHTHENKRESINRISKLIDSAYSQASFDSDLLAAFSQTVNEYNIPKLYFDQLIEGVSMDLDKNRYQNFKQLYDYCYKVAGVVGLIMLKVFGYEDKQTEKYAVDLGIAMQLTNILRDIKEDYLINRVYLPQDEMKQFNISESYISEGMINKEFIQFMQFQISRARDYYVSALNGVPLIKDMRSRIVVLSMKEIYAQILNAIEKLEYNVFKERAHTDFIEKIGLLLKILIQGKYLCKSI